MHVCVTICAWVCVCMCGVCMWCVHVCDVCACEYVVCVCMWCVRVRISDCVSVLCIMSPSNK